MRLLDQLKHSARASATFRGHKLTRFTNQTPNKTAIAYCVVCRKTVHVDAKPAPNGIDISSEAVALNCAPVNG
jgi:hypothetical protein